MKTIKDVLKKAADKIGGLPFTPAKVKAAGYELTEFFGELIGELEVCADAKNSKLVQRLVAMKDELKGAVK